MGRTAAGRRLLVLLKMLNHKQLYQSVYLTVQVENREYSGVCAHMLLRTECVCECVGPPQKAPLCAISEAAFLIRGHYMRLVRRSPGRGGGIRAQIRPSRPLTIPRHRGNET